MKVQFWGTRGSLPTPGPETIIYGGNTSCVSIQENDQLLILDAGSGIMRLGTSDLITKRIDILLTHLHMDHIQGLGFFQPLYDPEAEIHIWGSSGTADTLRTRLRRYLSPPLFPVRIRDLPCKLFLHELARDRIEIGDFSIYTDYVCHPSPTLGFRIQSGNTVLTYISDHEPALGHLDFPGDPLWTSGYSLAESADFLIHDAQFTPEEYEVRKGWGHSSIPQALQFAQLAGVKRLILFHHDPFHTDMDLKSLFIKHVASHSWPFQVELAEEGKIFTL